MAIQFTKATRAAVKLKIGIQGPSGAGKTDGALALATHLAREAGGRIAVIDTENGSASLYADRYDFDTLELRPPYESARYLEAIQAAADAGYAVIVIDSLSHQWAGEGGILARKEAKDVRGGNQWTNWAPFTKEHEGFKAGLLNAPVHIISTLRTKTEYVLTENAKGKQEPKKVGTAPIQRDGMEYEFSLMWELQMDHKASASKDRTGLFDGRLVDLRNPATARELIAWLNSGGTLAPDPTPAPVPATAPAEQPASERPAPSGVVSIDAITDELLTLVDDDHIASHERRSTQNWLRKQPRTIAEISEAIDRIRAKIAERANAA